MRSTTSTTQTTLIGPMQRALDEKVPGARIDVRQLDTGKPITMPVEIRISGGDMAALRQEAEKVKNILRATPYAQRVRDDWGEETFSRQASNRLRPRERGGHHQPRRGRFLGDGNQRQSGDGAARRR